MKYIITWVITIVTAGPCPIVVDEFGRESQIQSLVACMRAYEKPMRREFDNRDSAIAFCKRAEANNITPKMDSIKTK